MRIVYLNTWHGQLWDNLKAFILDQASSTDIFCFTEIDPEFQEKLQKILFDYNPIYDEVMKMNYLNGGMDAQTIFVRKGLQVEDHEKHQIYDITADDGGIMQTVSVRVGQKKLVIANVHGKVMPGEKLDTDERIRQSETIINTFKDKEEIVIIGGDFNLDLETESVKMFEKAGFKNLVKDFAIKTTRNRLSWERFNNIQYFADYTFVSNAITVKNFEVPNIEVSDHLPLVLDFEI